MRWQKLMCLLSVLGMLDEYLCKEIGTESDKNNCRLDGAEYLERCSAENGSNLSFENSLVVPAFSVCTFRHGTNMILKQCGENGEFLQLGKHMIRRKRTGIGTAIGAGIGSIFGPVGIAVGGAIGMVVDVFATLLTLCIVFCTEDPHPPTISCEKIATPRYAAKGTDKVTVSWHDPTAKDDEDGQMNK